MNVQAVEEQLVHAIGIFQRVPHDGMEYAHGYAQGIAVALAALRGTTFAVEWEAGLDAYQNHICGNQP